MPVARIERVIGGMVGSDGYFACHHFGSNVHPAHLSSLDEVADFLRSHLGSGVRMDPGWAKIERNLHIDGVLLR
ncbi:MAG: hypothetical protein EOS17_31605 [Mesorhizobium sp.]|nr:MAG: hypothetical protein EOS17_31605 [Mesorhizobium sp.]